MAGTALENENDFCRSDRCLFPVVRLAAIRDDSDESLSVRVVCLGASHGAGKLVYCCVVRKSIFRATLSSNDRCRLNTLSSGGLASVTWTRMPPVSTNSLGWNTIAGQCVQRSAG